MRVLRWLLVVSGIVLASACSLPSRDNGYDPAGAPEAHLAVGDLGGPSPCAVLDTNGGVVGVASVPHTHCVVLDASATFDRHGPAADLRYAFAFLDTAGRPHPLQAESARPYAVLDSAITATWAVGVPMSFEVTARSTSTHHAATATAHVLPRNTRPLAKAEAPRAFPLGGYPWSLGAAYKIVFDGSRSSDADHDPLVAYCWTLPDGTVLPCSPNPRVTYQASSSSAGLFTATLRVKDAWDESDATAARVSVGAPNLWANDSSGGRMSTVMRLDAHYRDFGTTISTAWDVRMIHPLSAPGKSFVLVLDPNQETADLQSWPDFTTIATQNGYFGNGGPLGAMRWDPAHDRLWLIDNMTPGINGPARQMRTFTVSAAGFTPESAIFEAPAGAFDNQAFALPRPAIDSAVDPAGNLFYGAFGSYPINEITPSGTKVDSWLPDPGSVFAGLDARPGTSEIWGVEGGNFFGSASGVAQIVRFQAGGILDRFPTAFRDAYGFQFVNDHEFWVVLGDKLLLVDVQILESTQQLSRATLTEVTLVSDFALRVDPITGDAWLQNATLNSLDVVTRDGSVTNTRTNLVPQTRDDAAMVWSVSGNVSGSGTGNVVRSASLPANGVDLTIPVFGGSALDLEGGLWATTAIPREIKHRASDGSVLQRISGLRQPDGTTTGLPPILAASVDPAGHLWGVTAVGTTSLTFEVVALDLVNPSAPDEARLLGMFAVTGFPEFISAVKGSPTGLAWFEQGGFSGTSFFTLDANLQAGPPFSLPAAETSLATADAVSQRDGTLCVVSADTTSTYVRQVLQNGTVRKTNTIASGSGSRPLAAAGSTESASACWAAWKDSASAMHVAAFDASGAMVRSYSDTGAAILSIGPVDLDHVWILRDAGGGKSTPELLTFLTTSTYRLADLPVAGVTTLLAQ